MFNVLFKMMNRCENWCNKCFCNRLDNVTEEDSAPLWNKEIEEYFNMDHTYRGTAYIFNHFTFDCDQPNRKGTDCDKKALIQTLSDLDFIVQTYDDLSFYNIHKIINKASKDNHMNTDCVVVAILSHGNEGGVYARDGIYDPNFLWKCFDERNCPSMKGKPVLFFIQACQGEQFDHGVEVLPHDQGENLHTNKDYDKSVEDFIHSKTSQVVNIRNQSNLLVAYSCPPGYFAWRSEGKGSWYIQTLCQKLNEHKYTHTLSEILTMVHLHVAVDYESVTHQLHNHNKKIIPCFFSTFVKQLKFVKKNNRNQMCNQM